MPALQVRDFPDDLYEELRQHAARNHRSIAQQTIAFVERGIRDTPSERDSACIYSLDFEGNDVREARIQKRRDIFEWAANLPWLKDTPSPEEVAAMFRDEDIEREKRQCEILGIPFREEFVR